MPACITASNGDMIGVQQAAFHSTWPTTNRLGQTFQHCRQTGLQSTH
jgi:hypothetical protein